MSVSSRSEWLLRAAWRGAVSAALLAGCVWAAYELGPSIDPRQTLPDDVAVLTESTWSRFEEAFPAQARCLTDVELELVDEVRDGTARYVASERLIRIEIPTSPRRYVESLSHELAHHLDVSCGAELEIGADFRQAQGFATDVAWNRGEEWRTRPVEHFAEAVVEYVTGDRFTHADIIDVSDEAVDIVRRWASGST